MDWTQALAQFAGNYIKSNAAQRKLEFDRKQKQAAEDAKVARWAKDYQLRADEAKRRAAEGDAQNRFNLGKVKLDDFGKGIESLQGLVGKGLEQVRGATTVRDANRLAKETQDTIEPVIAGLRFRYENDPDLRSIINPRNDIPFETFLKSRVASPFTSGTGVSAVMPVDYSKIGGEISKAFEPFVQDVGLNVDYAGMQDIAAPFIARLKQAGMTNEEIFSEFPMLQYGQAVESEIPAQEVATGAQWQPQEDVPIPGGQRPMFGANTQAGGFEYRRGLPKQLATGDFQKTVGSLFSSGEEPLEIGFAGPYGIPMLSDISNVMKQVGSNYRTGAQQQRAAQILSDPAFMNIAGVTNVSEYNNPEVRRRALGFMFATLPGYEKSAAGQKMASMLEAGPIERAPTQTVTKKVSTIKRPALSRKAIDEAKARGLDIVSKQVNISIDTIKRNFDATTYDDRVRKAHYDAILPPLKFDFERDKFLKEARLKQRGLDIQVSKLEREKATEARQYNALLLRDIPNLLNSTVNSLSGVVQSYGKALGNSITQAQIDGLATQSRMTANQIRAIVDKAKQGSTLSPEELSVFNMFGTISGGTDFNQARDNYFGASSKLNEYIGIRDNYSGYQAQALGMLKPGETLPTPSEDIFNFDDEGSSIPEPELAPAAAVSAPKPKPAVVSKPSNPAQRPKASNATAAGTARTPALPPVKPGSKPKTTGEKTGTYSGINF